MSHDEAPTTLLIELACGAQAVLKKNILDGLDLVEFTATPKTRASMAKPSLPSPVLGFGPLWTWDANHSDRRELPAVKVAQFEPEHVYKLLEGYFYLDLPGRPGFGPIAKVRWATPAAHH